jgi:hypothetical protein
MATFHEIFLRSLAADTDVVADVEHVLAVPLRRDLESPYIGGAQVSEDIVVEVLEDMALEDDGDMPLSTHPGLIIVRSLSKDKEPNWPPPPPCSTGSRTPAATHFS